MKQKKPLKMKMSLSRRIFLVVNTLFCVAVAFVCLMPVVHILAVSLSSKGAVFSGKVSFLPKEFTLDAYNIVVRDAQFFVSYRNSFIRTALGWAISLPLMSLAAYPLSLSRTRFPAKPFFTWFFMITILFGGGMIPTYLVVSSLGLIDTIWSLVLVDAVPVFNVILMMNFMKSLPDSLLEAAYLDGAGHVQTLVRVVLPLSKASIATVSLFVILAHWNAWFDGMIYIKSQNLKPLQTYLRSIVIVDSSVGDGSSLLEDIVANVTADSANGAKIFLAMLPILCVYPFFQKYFAKGIMRGSTKE